jgi:hypothetical protein
MYFWLGSGVLELTANLFRTDAPTALPRLPRLPNARLQHPARRKDRPGKDEASYRPEWRGYLREIGSSEFLVQRASSTGSTTSSRVRFAFACT